MGTGYLHGYYLPGDQQRLIFLVVSSPARGTTRLPPLPSVVLPHGGNAWEAIRRDPLIEGTPIPGSSNKICKVSQYADDTKLILANDFSIIHDFSLIQTLERGSGSRLNPKKTKGLWIGYWAGRTTDPVNITWVADKLEILGIFFGNTNLDCAKWADRVKKIREPP